MEKELRILMVEDVPTDAELEIRELKRAGLRIAHRIVETEEGFRKALQEFQPEIILSDFSMPRFDGMAALALAREFAPDVPFIFVSGTIGEEYAIRALKNGATDYVLKNNLVRLPAAVERAMRDARDITARKEAEKHRARLSTILEASPDFVATADPNRKVLYLNSAARRLLGLPENIDPSKVRIGDTQPPWAVELVLATGIPTAIRDGLWSGETAFLAPGGREVPVIQVILAHKGPDGSLEFLSTIARDISDRKRADDRIRRLNRVYAVLSGINATIVRVSDREELFNEACRIVVEAGGFRASWIGTIDANSLKLDIVASAGASRPYLKLFKEGFSLAENSPTGNSLTARAVREKKIFFSNDVPSDPAIRLRNAHLECGARSLAILPLTVANEPVAVLTLYSDEIGFFDQDELKLLTELAGDISFALDHIEKANKLDYLAYYDSLTGLANRALFHDRLSQYLRSACQGQGKLALILANVERFKTINHSLGRQAGDALLKQLAERLGHAADPVHIARLGSDNFAVVLPEIEGRSETGRAVEAIWRDCFAQPFQVNDTELRVSAKAGIALFPSDGADAEKLFASAEAALIKAKKTRERHVFHTRELTETVGEQLALENRLRRALENDEFVLHYQPKVDMASGHIVGAEALIRWQSPELGLVPPGKFIPLMEETGLILQVGSWALNRASRDHRRWVEQGLKTFRIAVNVSLIQLRQRDFVGVVEQAIIDGVAPTGVDLELTESVIMEDVEGNIRKLKEARGLGVGIAIDDFGTGYSSLGYLAKLPVQALKIDRSFIITMLNDPDTMTLVQTMISLAHSLRLKVIAEGVDAEEQAKILRLLRCDEMQGFLFSKPVPFDQMTAMLAQEKKA